MPPRAGTSERRCLRSHARPPARPPALLVLRHIVNIASLGAIAPASNGTTLYQASKYACRGFSLCAANDLRPHGIAVSCVLPDAVETRMAEVQLTEEECQLSFAKDAILKPDNVAARIVDDVLPGRAVETLLPATPANGYARIADIFPSSRLVRWADAAMRRKGDVRRRELLAMRSAKRD